MGPLGKVVGGFSCLMLCACSHPGPPRPFPAPDSIIVAGVAFHTATRVITWREPGAYNAYLEHAFFQPEQRLPSRPAPGCNTPRRYGTRSKKGLPQATRSRLAHKGWDLQALRQRVDQVILHYDACGSSRRCFQVLHDLRGLSVHFLVDLDGTIYQTMDLLERARHATRANDRSVGVEIAQIGAYSQLTTLWNWYRPDATGRVTLVPGGALKTGEGAGEKTRLAPARPGLFEGVINGRRLVQYDFTEAQYKALARLLAALHRALPAIRLKAPRTQTGQILSRVLSPREWEGFQGLAGHFHIQKNKIDPGPAFNWDRLLRETRARDREPAPGGAAAGGPPPEK